MPVRALFRAVKVAGAVAPYDTLHAKVFYPATLSGGAAERNLGVVPPDTARAPFPIVIFLNGVNGPPEVYQWLMVELAERGCVTVTYAWVTDQLPGGSPGLTPGVDLPMLTPEHYGKGPTCPAIAPLLAELARMDGGGPLAGLLDLSRVALGGHSAGGSAALLNANQNYFRNIQAAFTYGAHVQAATTLGHAPGSVFRLSDEMPFLIIGGNRDGVIAASSGRYQAAGVVSDKPVNPVRLNADATAPLLQTFNAINGPRGDRYLAILDGANHFSLAYPQDLTTGRPFLDHSPARPGAEIRAALSSVICEFLDAYLLQKPDADARFARRFSRAGDIWALLARK